jgi:hypothetical protein
MRELMVNSKALLQALLDGRVCRHTRAVAAAE